MKVHYKYKSTLIVKNRVEFLVEISDHIVVNTIYLMMKGIHSYPPSTEVEL